MQQHIQTGIHQIFSCFTERWRLLKVCKFVLVVGINAFLLKLKVKKHFLECSHEEVDSLMLFRTKSISAPNIAAKRTADTDALVNTLCNMPKLYQSLKVWLEVCITLNNTLRYVNVNKIYQNIGFRLCCALPGYHTFTSWGLTALFSRK